MPVLPSTRQGLRVTVRFHGRVVGQTVHWPWASSVLGLIGAEAVPTQGEGLARIHWEAEDRVRLEPLSAGVPAGVISKLEPWRWSDGAAVDVDLDLVPLQPAARGERGAGDMALLALVLVLTVAAGQIALLAGLLGGGAQGEAVSAWEPSPEYIARLLEGDYAGEDEGIPERSDRPEHEEEAPSFYMPAGNDGPLDALGGGAQVGDQVVRVMPSEDAEDGEAGAEAARELQIQSISPMLDEAGTPDEGLTGAQTDPVAELEPAEEEGAPDEAGEQQGPRTPMERFVGWGFRDWFDVKDSRADSVENELRRDLDLVRRRLRIDPDDPWAINTLGYYAYLAENHELGEQTFQRMIEMFPDDPAGYNNLGLVYKRLGQYVKEEALYRKALELDANDEHVLNNLAVNLAHQGRFDEAHAVMAVLEEQTPGDPYADLHRAKIYAAEGKRQKAYRYLEKALVGSRDLDTMHHIEFRQDIRLDPVFVGMRSEERFSRLLYESYGSDAKELLLPSKRRRGRGGG